jgi:hypothetical protein
MSLSPPVSPVVPALSFLFPCLRVGIAEYSAGSSGITFSSPARACLRHYRRPGWFTGDDIHGRPEDRIRRICQWNRICRGSAYELKAGCTLAAGPLSSALTSNKWSEVAIVPRTVVFDRKGRDN